MSVEYINVPVAHADKAYLQQVAREKGKSLTDVSRIAIQAYVYALKSKKRGARNKS